ncbi:MAG: polysaccharide biosynthesis tyrosine autokinase [Nocardioides sp.]
MQHLARALRRNAILILLCLAVTLGVAFVVTERETPQYDSTVRVLVSAPAGAEESESPAVLAATYADVATSEVLATRVVDRLLGDPTFRGDAGIAASTLLDQVSAAVAPGTSVIVIGVRDPDPATAQLIAQNYAEELIVTAADAEAGPLGAQPETPPSDEAGAPSFTIIDFATFDDQPASPQPLLVLLLAAGAGLLLGLVLTGFREVLTRTLRTNADVAALVGEPVLAPIARESARRRRTLVTDLDPDAQRPEAIRLLSTRLQPADGEDRHQVIVVTAAVAGEGTSSTAVDLALTLASAGARTLLVDANLRSPQVARTFDIDGSSGVSTVLLGELELEDALWTHPGTGLLVLPSGTLPPNPAELLSSSAMVHLLDRVRADHEVVVVDAAPLNPVTDAALSAARADGVLLVVRHGRTRAAHVRTAVERLHQVGATTIGVTLNAVPTPRKPRQTSTRSVRRS